ncbi:TonB-dependent receptor [Mucilaginibacter sp. UR6-11]|uniref:SusC/RagA family TonB-linked outer membrane protein n=1 Tax=Mucilaginibacter sp. UR6-11 TaxID=1435644 RepID=UPI001E2D9FC6|nr:TonB-dependent receptor [Mucilaginibacter sp. UR6-11]MCC8423694.1 TonB-dependent receptor [Mucilaginibacter sp. UR6-11]
MNYYTQLWKQFMRITILSFSILLTLGLLYVNAADVDAQSLTRRVNIRFDHQSLYQAVKKIQQTTNLSFAYDADYLGLKDRFIERISFNSQPLETILSTLFKGTNIIFKDEAGNILLMRKQQPGKISGKVTDETGEPLPGANIRVTGTTLGGVSDVNGNYAIIVPEGTYTIQATFVGSKLIEFKNVTISSDKPYILNIKITGGSTLDEVTVSYGKQRGREVTGAITQVDARPLQDMPVMQFGQQLQGKVAGVDVSQTSGQPGRGIAFRIRGAASFSTDYQPLFVIDGLPITGSINNINPDEIESFSVLKDASATALYGSRAANGVVLITTKHARPGDSKIVFSSNVGMQKIPQNSVPKVMNGQQWAEFMNEKFTDAKLYESPFNAVVPPVYQNPSQYGEGTDWFKLTTRTAPIQKYNLSVLSSREKSSSAVVLGYETQDGVLINSGTKLLSLRINQDMTLGSHNQLKVGFNLAPSYRMDHNNRINTDGVGGFYERIFEASPINKPYNPDGTYAVGAYSTGMSAYVNPLALLNETMDDYITTRILANGFINYEFLPGFSLKTNVGVDKGAETRSQFSPSITLSTSAAAPAASTGISSSVDNFSYTAESYLNYERRFHEDHHIEALAGYSIQKFDSKSNSISGTGFPNDDIPYLSAASVISAASSSTTQYSLLSAIGRLNYDYKGKYLLQGAVRQDGSSRFGEERKYGYFPSVSAGWIVSDEKFMEQFKQIDLLKVRVSYGITGNNSFGNYTAIPTLSKYNYLLNGVLIQGQTIGTLGNTELAWEKNKQFDIGLELNLFKNRISVNYDYYHKLSDGLIQARPIPRASGFANIQYNIGQLEFWGHEITVNTINTTGKLKWTTSVNVAFERNLIKNLVDPGYLRRNNTVTSDYYRNQVGHHLGEFYGFVNLGLYKDAADLATSAKYQSTGLSNNGSSDIGTLKMKDLNNDGIIDDVNDRTFIGDPTPDFTFGITNNFTYKNFDLNISMAGQIGGQILAAAKWAYLTNLDGSRVPLAAALDHWRSEANPGSGVYPRTKTGTTAIGRSVNTQWVENGSYLTAKNISLGYNFKLNKLLLKNLRVYGSVQQAFIITGYSGANPEIGLSGSDALNGIGVDENAYPVPRTYSAGVVATFK